LSVLALKGREIPAQGNALGPGRPTLQSPERARHTSESREKKPGRCLALSGLRNVARRKPRAPPWAGMSRPSGAPGSPLAGEPHAWRAEGVRASPRLAPSLLEPCPRAAWLQSPQKGRGDPRTSDDRPVREGRAGLADIGNVRGSSKPIRA